MHDSTVKCVRCTPTTRTHTHMIAAYMKEAAPANNSDFDLIQYWTVRVVDGVDASGKVVVPARLPHVRLLARL